MPRHLFLWDIEASLREVSFLRLCILRESTVRRSNTLPGVSVLSGRDLSIFPIELSISFSKIASTRSIRSFLLWLYLSMFLFRPAIFLSGRYFRLASSSNPHRVKFAVRRSSRVLLRSTASEFLKTPLYRAATDSGRDSNHLCRSNGIALI